MDGEIRERERERDEMERDEDEDDGRKKKKRHERGRGGQGGGSSDCIVLQRICAIDMVTQTGEGGNKIKVVFDFNILLIFNRTYWQCLADWPGNFDGDFAGDPAMLKPCSCSGMWSTYLSQRIWNEEYMRFFFKKDFFGMLYLHLCETI